MEFSVSANTVSVIDSRRILSPTEARSIALAALTGAERAREQFAIDEASRGIQITDK